MKSDFLGKIIDEIRLKEYADTMKKTLFLYPLIFIVTVMVCLLFLMISAAIPQEAIRDNTMQSAEYFSEVALFENSVGNLENFKKDNYADCITTGIAWHFGEGNPYQAVISADYNSFPDENVNVSFYREMHGEEVETESYARYWHGAAGIVRILLLVANIKVIRYIIAAAGVILNAALVVTLIRKQQKVLGIFYGIAFLLVNGLFALFCLEYAFIFLLMPIAAIFLITNKRMVNAENAQMAFLVIGILSAFLDFLTTETLTFTVPFAIYYIVVLGRELQTDKKIQRRKDWLFLIKSGVCWCIGYVGMFLAKWGLAAVTLGKEAFKQSADMAMERISGEVSLTLNMAGEKADLGQRLQGIFLRNAGCLYWSTQDIKPGTVVLITIIAVAVIAIFWYMARKEKYVYDKAAVLAVIAMVPYLRFLVVSNHAYIHYFFTYRALLVTVMILLYLIYKTTIFSDRKGKRRRKKDGKKN